AATRGDVYRASRALVAQYIAGFATPPKALVLDLDHSKDQAYGQQPLVFYPIPRATQRVGVGGFALRFGYVLNSIVPLL
ncbi:MAG: hypothetical protein GW936_03820, partial [Gallionella sp.]|nr:hypothetical protein [Gallionella sp.]